MLKDSWDKSDSKSISKRMLEKVRQEESLPKRIAAVQSKFTAQISYLEKIETQLEKKGTDIFQKTVGANRSNATRPYARVYAQELANLRRIQKMIKHARLSMERVRLRLDTISEVGDIVVTLSPCMSVIRELTPSLSRIMPQADESMQDLSQMLGDVISSSSVNGIAGMNTDTGYSSEASAILNEANNVLIGAAHESIPNVPQGLQSGGGQPAPPMAERQVVPNVLQSGGGQPAPPMAERQVVPNVLQSGGGQPAPPMAERQVVPNVLQSGGGQPAPPMAEEEHPVIPDIPAHLAEAPIFTRTKTVRPERVEMGLA